MYTNLLFLPWTGNLVSNKFPSTSMGAPGKGPNVGGGRPGKGCRIRVEDQNTDASMYKLTNLPQLTVVWSVSLTWISLMWISLMWISHEFIVQVFSILINLRFSCVDKLPQPAVFHWYMTNTIFSFGGASQFPLLPPTFSLHLIVTFGDTIYFLNCKGTLLRNKIPGVITYF